MNHTIVKVFRAVFVAAMMLTSGNAMADGVVVKGNVYGGGNLAAVGKAVTVNIMAGQIGDTQIDAKHGNVYGGGALANTNTDALTATYFEVTLEEGTSLDGYYTEESGTYTLQTSGTSAANGHYYKKNETIVNLTGGKVKGDVYGGGLGQLQEGAEGSSDFKPAIAALVYGEVTVNVNGGTAQNVFGCNNLNGAPQKDVIVNIKNGEVKQDVYGGGNQADAPGKIIVNMEGGTVTNDVYGGGALADTNTANWVSGNLVYSYLPVTGLTTGTSSVDGYYTLSEGVYSPASGKAAANTDYYEMQNTTAVNLVAGTINGNVYGGGLGKIAVAANTEQNIAAVAGVEAKVYGDVTVKLNEAADNCIVNGSIFGCNNLNGSPQGSVTVHVYGTKGIEGKPTKMTRDDYFAATDAVKEAHRYDLKAVYGGGNKAAYTPVNSLLANSTTNADKIAAAHTNVIIDGCDRSSIWQVYGGGNAASTPGTSVTIKGTYEIGEVFGGGNGANTGEYSATNPNPGANVGYAADKPSGAPGDQYGSGKAQVNINGGLVHSVFGGSNTKGNVREVAVAMLEETKTGGTPNCPFVVDEAYGGGKSAQMDGEARLQLGCIPGVGRVYGGAMNADVKNNVNLRIENGVFNKVYGGNNLGGRILGSITVEVEEIGCTKIEIDELYGGGNQAGYSVYGYKQVTEGGKTVWKPRESTSDDGTGPSTAYANPQVKVFSATRIGKVFGGGDNALMVGEPRVTINMVAGVLNKNDDDADDNTTLGNNVTQTLGKIGQVFGGGNKAGVIGSPYVNISNGQIQSVPADKSTSPETLSPGVYGGCNEQGTVSGDTHVTLTGGTIGESNALAELCGGGFGKATIVSGTAYVNIGTGTAATDAGASSIVGDIYGGSAYGKVVNAEVNIYKNTSFTGDVYGGGKGKFIASGNTGNILAEVTGKSTVNMYATTITGHIYGGCNEHGLSNEAEVNMLGGTLGVVGTPKADLLFAGGHGKETTTKTAFMNIGSVDETTTPHTYSGSATIYSNVYGGSALGAVGVSTSNEVTGSATVNLYQATRITGDVFGDGMGDVATNAKARMGNSTVNLYDIALPENIFGGCNYNGTVYGKATVNLIGGSVAKDVYGGGQGQLTQVANSGSVEVNVGTAVGSGSTTVTGDIYGGSAFGGVNSPIVNVYSATSIGGNVFGGGKGQLAAENQAAITATVTGKTTVNMKGATVPKAIYGGCNENGTSVDAEINVTGGTVGSTTKTADVLYGVFGGGYGQSTSVTGNVTVNIASTINGDVYGGSAQGNVNKKENATTKTTTTTVHLNAGKVDGNVYGGGLGVKPTGSAAGIPANVYGDVLVDLNDNDGTCAVTGYIFGCNNTYGSPEGHVTVHVYKTVPGGTSTCDLAAVYGGGNEADYEPNDSKLSTEVIIENCDATSIENVYGGGNAAASPATEVWILGSKEIKNVFGGGNGEQGADYAANVGFKSDGTAYSSGSGKAQSKLVAGKVTTVYGGSNSNGDIRGGTWITMPSKSDYTSSHPNVSAPNCCENLEAEQIYGGGKNADMSGGTNVVLGCQPDHQIDEIYAGAQNADIKGDVSLTITSGIFGRVFGGNKYGGALQGAITVNIEESGEGCGVPIVIGELYGGGNLADYSIYGYKEITDPDNASGTIVVARSSLSDNEGALRIIGEPAEGKKYSSTQWYADPKLNVCSFTSIGKIFGAGYKALMAANPTVDINVVRGSHYDDSDYHGGTMTVNVPATATNPAETLKLSYPTHKKGEIGAIGSVFGGGNLAKVVGNSTVNIGTESSVTFITEPIHLGTKGTDYIENSDYTFTATVEGANITENVYGGGNQADVTGNTHVNICAKKGTGDTYTSVVEGTSKVIIGGDVYGGGKGLADNFLCDKAMVGTADAGLQAGYSDGNTSVVIGNGTVNGSLYGGGQIGRVERNTTVIIGIGDGTETGSAQSAPVIMGNVFGAGKGDEEHGYAALVRGNPSVTIQGKAKIGKSVYGGGEIASVARYKVATTTEEAAAHGVEIDMPYVLESNDYGHCVVNVGGYAEIGPDNMQMYHENVAAGSDKPDDYGHVFGAGRGVLPTVYASYGKTNNGPKRMVIYNEKVHTDSEYWTYVDPSDPNNKNVWEYFVDKEHYFEFIQTLALATETEVTIGDNAFVKGSVYGGSENGLVQFDTDVTIEGDCQIGAGFDKTTKKSLAKYTDWTAESLAECASWVYGKEEGSGENKKTIYAPYDPFANASGDLDKYPTVGGQAAKSTEGGRRIATDGHTYYGNVFGGGSGSVPYFDDIEGISKYLPTAGQVKGKTKVTIAGGHILTNVYGGNEATDVLGTSEVLMTAGTIGVPRTDGQIIAHPLTGYIFGAGKGDQRIFFNKETNVNEAIVTVEGGRIYGSVYGGGEDGHVMRNTTVTIGKTGSTGPTIGTKGTSYYDGNVFGGGRGFGGDALTAGNVGGTVTLNIESGNVLGSVYGGGRLASVGYGLYLVDEVVKGEKPYGKMREDGYDDRGNAVAGFKRGYININISGGTIGNDVSNAEYGGNVFGGSMGSLTKQDGTVNGQWDKFATAKKTTVNVSGGTIIKRSVYGGGELGSVTTDAIVKVSGGTIGDANHGGVEFGNVYGGGKGYVDPAGTDYITAGIIKGNTSVTIENGTNTTPTIYHNIYGGGAYGSVGEFDYDATTGMPKGLKANTSGGKATVTVAGGNIGRNGKENGMVFGSSRGNVGAPGEIHDKLAWVNETEVTINGGQIKGSVYGGGENGHIYTDAAVNVHGGTIGIAEGEPIGSYSGANYPYRGNVYGGGCGTDMYYSDRSKETGKGDGDTYNPLAGIVLGKTTVSIDGGHVVHNVYGAGAMGSVGTTTKTTKDNKEVITYASGGTTTIAISGGKVGVDGEDNGNVFGAARGDATTTQTDVALVKTTDVTISGSAKIMGSVYGGGEVGDVGTYSTSADGTNTYLESSGDCVVTVNGGEIYHNVFGAGKGIANTFTCQKAMVNSTIVTITNGTVDGSVYGGGEVGRVETNAVVKIGEGTGGTSAPEIKGNVFGAGAGLETHGYSALVRGNSTVTIDGNAKVRKNVYGGGELATVGKYWVTGVDYSSVPDVPTAPTGWPDGMPYATRGGGLSTVTIQGNATIGPETGDATETEGQVFGAGKGVNPHYVASGTGQSERMNNLNKMEPFATEGAYLQFLETLALVSNTQVTIGGNAVVKASVFGGSESGFVQDHTSVAINDNVVIGTSTTPTYGNVFGGGKGLESFAEAGRVRGNTTVAFNGGTAYGSVYGGGKLGDVGTIDKTDINNYIWSGYGDGDTDTSNDTGVCSVSVTGGTVHKNVFGAGKGSGVTFQCEKAMAYNTEVTISDGTVNGNIYGGGEVGRVENATQVTIGRKTGETEGNGTGKPDIKGSVFGAGKGLATHGYSALVRGNTAVTVEGASGAKVGTNVYGGGEIASVGRYGLNAQKMPNILLGGGRCIVKVLGDVVIGPENASDDKGNVFGAGKGVDTPYDNTNKPQRMTLDGSGKSVYETIAEDDYATYLETLALVTHPEVTIDGHATVNGSVFGGGELGLTKGSVIVNINNGTIEKDVYGGGALANTNTTHEVGVEENGKWKMENGEYVTTIVHPTTTVNLTGGLVNGDAYGGGLGRLGSDPIGAKVFGDVNVTLDGTAFNISHYTTDAGKKVVKSGRVFGCNNLNGSPKGDVTVTINKTVAGNVKRTDEDPNNTGRPPMGDDETVERRYELAAVYGGGNLADYVAEGEGRKTHVIINSCDVSVEQVYGGGNAAKVPETDVLVNGAYEIYQVFGGGNGADKYTLDDGVTWNVNPGADIDGNTNTLLKGGYIHEAYGASNEKGTITGSVTIDTGTGGDCQVQVDKLVAAGKNADVNGDLIVILGCKDAAKIPIVYGGADNANVNGNVELTITSGHFGQVFGGNNLGGVIRGHVILNIEETSECEPIRIDELYLGGNQAAYSRFGYYVKTVETEAGTGIGANGETAVLTTDENKRLIFVPRTSATDSHLPVNTYEKDDQDKWTWTTTAIDAFTPYDQPVLNLISCTEVGEVFGGGFGEGGDMYANPTVNINMIPGYHAKKIDRDGDNVPDNNEHALGIIGNVYGGGNLAAVVGDATINIGTEKAVTVKSMTYDPTTKEYTEGKADVEGANITGNVYGGGNKADIIGNTHVNICAKEVTDSESNKTSWQSVTYGTGLAGVSIDKKANGADDTGGSVFGGGCSADVLGNTFVRVSGGYVFNGVFGGGYAGSVGKFTRSTAAADTDIFGHTAHEGCLGKPVSCEEGTGKCTVVVDGGQIGPIEVATLGMKRSKADGGPVPQGWVWGGGQGVIDDPTKHPDTHFQSYVGSTDVTIGGTAFVLESIIGGGEFGRVLGNTLVKIEGGQIGVGEGMVDANNKPIRYTDDQFINPTTTTVTAGNALKECSHFDYGFDNDGDGKLDYLPYDPYYEDYPAYVAAHPDLSPACTSHPSDGKTWIGCVFAGGSGYMPYKKEDGSGYDWCSSAGWVEGNTEVVISGGHILTNVYGGNEYTNVKGKSIVTMTGGTIGVPRTVEQIQKNPLTCYLFGAGRGDQRTHFNKETNVGDVEVNVTGGIIYGSVFGGGEDGHVIRNAVTNIGGDVIIGTTGTSYVDGNVFGGGRGFSGEAQTAGTVGGNVELNITGGKILGSVYGGGRLASVGTEFTAPNDPNYGQFKEDDANGTYGHVVVNISGGTIGNGKDGEDVTSDVSGNVFGASMGRLTLINGDINPIWPKMAQVKSSVVNVYGNAVVKRTVFGGGELGTVRDNAYVTIGGKKTSDADANGKVNVEKDGSPVVRMDVYGGGYGSEDNGHATTIKVYLANSTNTGYDEARFRYTPMQFAGCVGQNTYVNVVGGQVRKSVYGGGEMASVGIINYQLNDQDECIGIVKHEDANNSFALSWPYEFKNFPGYPGDTHVTVTGGRIGLKGGETNTFEDKDNGDVYGGGKGIAGDFNNYIYCANVGSTNVTIDYPNTADPASYDSDGSVVECVTGAVYGGAENGHVMGDTKVTLKKGLIGHSVYGGGSGKGQFPTKLLKIGAPAHSTSESDYYTRDIYSITAGKVFGNTEVIMEDGYVVRNVYGGGNMGSVGKGNYAGGADDYSTVGYGETLSGNLWDGQSKFSEAFLNSGKSTVKILGGTVGYIASDPSESMYPANSTASLPYGNVFGGCRGESAPNIRETPRYLYSPEFFVGYVNETDVTIGDENGSGPTIIGSVYGGGMDGHVRRDTHVEVLGGEIGIPYTSENIAKVQTKDLNNTQWLARGNVYGAGSGIGKYKYDFDYDGKYTSTVKYHDKDTKEEDYSTSAGSVTRFTTVDVMGGTIYRNVYGGGSLSSVGAPKIGQDGDPYHPDDSEHSGEVGKQSLNTVTVSGGQIGDTDGTAAGYGGNVNGGSRGDINLGNSFSTAVFTDVAIDGTADVKGNVFGGGEAGMVMHDTNVKMLGGTVGNELYGGGDMADVGGNTTVSLTGGQITNTAYGGARGTADNAANVGGDVLVELNKGVAEDAKGCIVDKVFGANNVNGTPTGHVLVHVYATQNASTENISTKIGPVYSPSKMQGDSEGYIDYLSRLIAMAKPNGTVLDGIDAAKISTAEATISGKTEKSLEPEDKTAIGNAAKDVITELDNTYSYDVTNVFGGGKSSDYVSAVDEPKQSTEVIIEGCDLTSINEVYGGGYGAATPGTNVLIKGSYIINNVFGGGYGAGTDNPGANVGYKTYPLDNPPTTDEAKAAYVYGSGKAVVELIAGKLRNVYGGSNSKGDIREGSSINANTTGEPEGYEDPCDVLKVDTIYGGGKDAPMEGGTEIVLDCMPKDWVGEIYAGAANADVANDVSLTITSGKFGSVFGGNKEGGELHGSITVNIEECDVCPTPIIIGELYGGGNRAPYSIYGYYEVEEDGETVLKPRTKEMYDAMTDEEKAAEGIKQGPHRDPIINIRSFTSIGNVYGGGLGEDAELIGNPTVNINEAYVERDYAGDYSGETRNGVVIPKYIKDKDRIGVIGNVFGGGNAAKVIGNTTVNVGTEQGDYVRVNSIIPGKTGVKSYFVKNEDGTFTKASGVAQEGVTYYYLIVGANVQGNIYGGGNAAEVTGNTNVVIGKKKE